MAAAQDVEDDELLDAVLTASRSLVAISAQSIAAVSEQVDVVQLRVLVVVASQGPLHARRTRRGGRAARLHGQPHLRPAREPEPVAPQLAQA